MYFLFWEKENRQSHDFDAKMTLFRNVGSGSPLRKIGAHGQLLLSEILGRSCCLQCCLFIIEYSASGNVKYT